VANDNSSARHLPALDGLRGVAILAVLLFHFGAFEVFRARPIVAGFDVVSRTLLMIGLGGWSGVDLFFVLSGFLITSNLLSAKGRGGYFRVFYWRRFLRIFPAYYLCLVVMEVLLTRVFPQQEIGTNTSWRLWVWTYLTNRLISAEGWDALPQSLHHFWSLAVEEQFYLLWPFLIFSLNRQRAMVACGFFLVTSLALRIFLVSHNDNASADVLMETRMDSLSAGALLALVAQGEGGLLRWRRPLQLVGATCGLLLVGYFAYRGSFALSDPLVVTAGYSVLALGSVAAVALCVLPVEGVVSRAMRFAPLRGLGKYSYGLYLIHHPVVVLLWEAGTPEKVFTLAGGEQHPLPAALLAHFILPGALSVTLAMLSWHLFEKQVLKLKDRIGYAPAPGVAST
jgi:peptidoglycan/LPS O-acetylase OafA/YrhL